MKKAISVACAIFLLGVSTNAYMSAQTPKQIHIDGPKAMKLVSLLASGKR